MLAISESVRGEGLALTLATELLTSPMSGTARICLFIPKPNTGAVPPVRFFHADQRTRRDGVMENSATRLKRYAESLKKFRIQGTRLAAL